ncbi:MAG: carboxylesterase family protein [Polyangiaceae bacterium]
MGESAARRRAWLLLSALVLFGCGEDADPEARSLIQPGVDVDVQGGSIHGEAEGSLRVFRGIPYAAPPLGDLRFRKTTPHPGWEGRLDTTAFGPGCPQNGNSTLNPVAETAEDCLTLNVWAHENRKDDALRPVMVYLHGGGFVSGAGSSPLYEASRIARRGDVVVVTLNYRLGALGFLATAELRAESPDGSVGNYGLLDQRAALGWIHDNIAIFGGDPTNVTLFGQSSGSVAICAQLAMAGSRDLVARAILQSGGGCADVRLLEDDPVTPGGTLGLGESFVRATPCADAQSPVECMRRLPLGDLLEAQQQVPANLFGNRSLGPSVDGVLLPAQPIEVLEDAPEARPLLTGSMSREFALFVVGGVVKAETEADYHQLTLGLTGDANRAADLESVFPLSDFDSVREAVVTLGSEAVYACPARALAAFTASRGAPAFNYEMRASVGGLAGAVGPAHGLDVPFVFGTLDASSLLTYDEQDRALSDTMIELWTHFATNSAPDTSSGWEPIRRGTLVLEEQGVRMVEDPSAGRCAKLEQLGLVPL